MASDLVVANLENWRPRPHCSAIRGGGFWYLQRRADHANWTSDVFPTAHEALTFARQNFPGVAIEPRWISELLP